MPLLLMRWTGVVAAAAAAVRRVPDGKIVAGSLNLVPSSFFCLFIQTRCIFHVCTLGGTVVFTASI